MDVREKLVDDVHSKLMGLLQRAQYIRCEDVHRQYAVNWLMNNGVTVQDWIPVTKPPKEKGVYIVTVKHWLDGKPVTREAKWNGADWLSCYKAEEITPRVTHWTYMPQPPKGE